MNNCPIVMSRKISYVWIADIIGLLLSREEILEKCVENEFIIFLGLKLNKFIQFELKLQSNHNPGTINNFLSYYPHSLISFNSPSQIAIATLNWVKKTLKNVSGKSVSLYKDFFHLQLHILISFSSKPIQNLNHLQK